MEIVKSIHQIKIPFPRDIPEQTNIYIVEGTTGNIMVDAGWDTPEALSALNDELKKDHLRLKDIKEIIITHIHPDHYGLASKVKQLCGAKIAMHSVEAGLINPRYVNLDELLKETEGGLKRGGVPQAELPELGEASLWMKQFVMPEPPDIMLNDGDRITNGSFEFEVLRTPGHSPGHICLYDSDRRLLFSGDHVLFDTTPHVGFHPQSGDDPLGDYINSLKMMMKLGVNFVFPGHGPVFNSLKLRIAEIIRHHEQRKQIIIDAISDGLKTAYQVAEEIPWRPQEGGVAFRDLALWDRRLAVMETIAHLNSLMDEGEVGKIDQDGVFLYLSKG
jgi:glyoxylase-like metal-dependent hydrolase (beta-lactamase superfamily II)